MLACGAFLFIQLRRYFDVCLCPMGHFGACGSICTCLWGSRRVSSLPLSSRSPVVRVHTLCESDHPLQYITACFVTQYLARLAECSRYPRGGCVCSVVLSVGLIGLCCCPGFLYLLIVPLAHPSLMGKSGFETSSYNC